MTYPEEMFLDSCYKIVPEEVASIPLNVAELLLPSQISTVVGLAGSVFAHYHIRAKVEKIGPQTCRLSLFQETEQGLTAWQEFTGSGPAALNLAYMRAVVGLVSARHREKERQPSETG